MVEDTPLKLSYPKLHEYSRKKQCTVQECWREVNV
jgi:glucuronate isomerase